jgi:hypothetical protein
MNLPPEVMQCVGPSDGISMPTGIVLPALQRNCHNRYKDYDHSKRFGKTCLIRVKNISDEAVLHQ